MKSFLARNLIRNLEKQPIFVVGAFRSGTSILLQALGAHPLVFAARGEAPLISFTGDFLASFESQDKIVHTYLGDSVKVQREYIYAQLKRLNFEIAFGHDYGLRRIVKGLLEQRVGFLRKRYWAAKVFPDDESCRGIRCLYPEAKFIYIVRNGFHVVQSRMHFAGFKHDSFEDHCHNWQNDGQKYAYLEDEGYALQVYYEELLTDPGHFFNKIFERFDLPPDNNSAKYANKNLIHPLDQKDKREVDVREILKSRPEPYEKWSEEQKRVFVDICAPGMEKHGYKIPFDWGAL